MEEQIDLLWKFLESRRYYDVRETCRRLLDTIEKDLSDDFGKDLRTTLYEDTNEVRRENYLEILQVYQKALRGIIMELVLQTDDITDIDRNFQRYQSLRQNIETEMSKVTYLLGDHYRRETFMTASDLEGLDELMREHCQLILKREFFGKIKIVIQELGSLGRKNFHKVTASYKSLRGLCHQCLEILAEMKEGRFFGEHDTFIEDYEGDVKIYLQVLWYLAIKTDLNKMDKFLHPNTYSKGLDKYCQVFAVLSLMGQILPHLEEARNIGLSDKATTELLEGYAEYLYKIITHEETQAAKEDSQKLQETDRLIAEKKSETFRHLKSIIERHTKSQVKTRYRLEFALKLFRGTPFAFRLGSHKRVTVPNPDGRVLRSDTSIAQTLEALKAPIFYAFLEELKMQYRSRYGLKLQALRWEWFAERELKEEYFEKPKYNYLKYIHTEWKETVQDHWKILQQLSERDDDVD